MNEVCPRCIGTGYEEFYNVNREEVDVKRCTYCNGTGVVK